MNAEPVFVGIDVSKASLDVAVHRPATRWTVAYTEATLPSLVARLTALAPALIVLEATGGLEVPLVGAFYQFIRVVGIRASFARLLRVMLRCFAHGWVSRLEWTNA